MTQCLPENLFTAGWSLVPMLGNTMPPRDPDDDDDDDGDDDRSEPEDEHEHPVVREPDEDE